MNSITLAYSVISLYLLTLAFIRYSADIDLNKEGIDLSELKNPKLLLTTCILWCVNVVWTLGNSIYLIVVW